MKKQHPLRLSSAEPTHKLGDVIEGEFQSSPQDGCDVHGLAEFVYMKGSERTRDGSWVTYDPETFETIPLVHGAKGPVAISMSVNIEGNFGWYQTRNIHVETIETKVD